jgi:hypothetical protein
MIRSTSLVLAVLLASQLSLCFAQTGEQPAPPPPRLAVQSPAEEEGERARENDKLDPDRAPEFDAELESLRSTTVTDYQAYRTMGEQYTGPPPETEWEINDSASVFWLDAKDITPHAHSKYRKMYPSYADLLAVHPDCLPSVNLIDAKAKQFDDGLYAALDLAYYRGLKKVLASHVELIERIGASTEDRTALSFLSAGLSYAGRPPLPGADPQLIRKFQADFEQLPINVKPIGFYTWTEELSRLFRFMRFFMRTIPDDQELCLALCRAIVSDEALRSDYESSVAFYGRLTNPRIIPGLDDFYCSEWFNERSDPDDGILRPVDCPPLWPPSTSRESVFFASPLITPDATDLEDAPLMALFISAIKNGAVDLQPKGGEGWYQYQAYALQSFLLPCEGLASQKLLFSKGYKKRIEETFAALLTKRRETHVRQLGSMGGVPPMAVSPKLRLEPNPLFYLRTARAYSFLQEFLHDRLGKKKLRKLHGVKDGGLREPDLDTELEWMRQLFYGCYLICCEDIGLRPDLQPGELDATTRARARKIALGWLGSFHDDPDLAVDTRVAVPIDTDQLGDLTIWATVGVRFARLSVSYTHGCAPSIRRKGVAGDPWQPAPETQTRTYYIPVDLFVEAKNAHGWLPDRAELREICDQAETEEQISEMLSRQQ